MSAMLAADGMLSVLTALALLMLRHGLDGAGLTARLRKTLRFATMVLAAFYLSRAVMWVTGWMFINRLHLGCAALIPLAILLVVEAALRRHIPRWLKLVMLVTVPVMFLSALFWPFDRITGYLRLLLAFQLLILLACAWLLWTRSGEAGQGSAPRVVAVLIAVSLPLVAADFGFVRAGVDIHPSTLAVMLGVWLLFGVASGAASPRRVLGWTALLLALATATGLALNTGYNFATIATLFGVLIFTSLVAAALDRGRTALETSLARLLVQPRGTLSPEYLADALRDHAPIMVADADLAEAGDALLLPRLQRKPLCSAGADRLHDDADDALRDLLRRYDATHLLMIGAAPLRLMALRLGPENSGRRTRLLLTALSRRMEGENADD